ncbi:GTPase Der [Sesamum alatum]|uniref:GTPase Der n=1 Tax=Sesamum alatum TaxID=300844 RepID=A0AAE2D0M3_9LAMI|nr:GTPase Der [Sesamum alatum]
MWVNSPISGTTCDAIDTEFTGSDGQKFRLIDMAGIRKGAAVASSGSTTEALSVNRAFRAICRSDVVALVIEAMSCIMEQKHTQDMDKQLRSSAGFTGTPIRLLWRSRRKLEKDEGKDASTRTQVNLSQFDRKSAVAA